MFMKAERLRRYLIFHSIRALHLADNGNVLRQERHGEIERNNRWG